MRIRLVHGYVALALAAGLTGCDKTAADFKYIAAAINPAVPQLLGEALEMFKLRKDFKPGKKSDTLFKVYLKCRKLGPLAARLMVDRGQLKSDRVKGLVLQYNTQLNDFVQAAACKGSTMACVPKCLTAWTRFVDAQRLLANTATQESGVKIELIQWKK